MQRAKSIFLLPEDTQTLIYNPGAMTRIQQLTKNDGRALSREDILKDQSDFKDVEIVFSGWGSPVLDEELLNALPSLKAYFYGAGSVRSIVTEEFWKRNIILTSAYTANAIPVAEFTVAMVNLSLKKVWFYNQVVRDGSGFRDKRSIPGMYTGSKVGIISLGAIGRLVCRKLSELQADVFAFDPFADDRVFKECGAERAESLEWIFENCDAISLHTPWLPETENMITGEHFRAMRSGSSFVNTSRGMVVDEPQMLEVLTERPDIYAVIDVIQDESAYLENPLGKLPNVFLTPHIAGSMGRECHRMGDLAVEECQRFLSGEPQVTQITRESAVRLA